jgi:phenylalanyl-tRNA synthetase beta chain
MAALLGRLGYKVSYDGDNMHIVVPSWRSTGDVSIKADIMEEVARMYGYENFEPTPITTSFDSAINQLDYDLVRHIKEYLALRCGMREIFTYPWMSDRYAEAIIADLSHTMKLTTPPAPDQKLIRSSLLPNICEAVAKNERAYEKFSIFEEAQVISDESFESKYDERELLPLQKRYVAGAFVGSYKELEALFREAKGVLEYMPRHTHMEGFAFVKNEKPSWSDDTVWLNVVSCGKAVGNIGLLNKKAAMNCDIKNAAVILFEIDTTQLVPFTSRTNKFTHLPAYPLVDYDISVLFNGSETWESVYAVLKKEINANPLLHSASFVEEYRGKQIPEGKKSVTIRLVIGSLEKTLTSQEIEKCANAVLDKLNRAFNATIRQ